MFLLNGVRLPDPDQVSENYERSEYRTRTLNGTLKYRLNSKKRVLSISYKGLDVETTEQIKAFLGEPVSVELDLWQVAGIVSDVKTKKVADGYYSVDLEIVEG